MDEQTAADGTLTVEGVKALADGGARGMQVGRAVRITSPEGVLMSRRIVPVTFGVGVLVCAAALAVGMGAARPPARVPNLLGTWDGFFQVAGQGGVPGRVVSGVTQQARRSIAGRGSLLDSKGRLLDAYRFQGTVVRDDFLSGTGQAGKERLVFQAGLETFASSEGDAGVMQTQFRLVSARGRVRRINALLLHPFPGVDSPDIAGSVEGPFLSLPDPMTGAPADPNFRGICRLQISPRNARGTFPGRAEFFLQPGQPPVISWPLLATTSDDRRFLYIAQGASGRIIYQGVVIPSDKPTGSFRLDGVFRLNFNDGRSLFNAFNFSVSRR